MLGSPSTVEHIGEVVEVGADGATICIQRQAACKGCSAQNLCGMGDKDNSRLIINTQQTAFLVGERVRVLLKRSHGVQALLYGYILPFLLVLIALIMLTLLGLTEGAAGLIALSMLAPYYFCLYLFRNRLSRKFTFSILPLHNSDYL